ncbi:MAG: PASTA domain-containing protein [Clostridiales bacterium]|nr:PASTA domain-containing protein [Clostridiales bacterium]
MRKNKVEKRIRGRLTIVFFLLSFILCGLGGRVFYWKYCYGEEFETQAKSQQVERYDSIIPPARGQIVDRNKQPLALSLTVYNVVLDPILLSEFEVEDQERTLNALSEALELNYSDLKWYITVDPATGKLNRNNHWVYLKKSVDREIKEQLEAQDVKGVFFEKATKRKYPLGTLAAHVIGFIRGDAKWGLEYSYDEEMTGVPGRSFVTYDGGTNAATQEIPAEDGDTVVTTIDYTIQQYAQEAVEEAMQYNPMYAAALVMDPNTAEIVAMASSPTYDPNDPTNPVAGKDNAEFQKEWEQKSDEEKIEYLNTVWKNFNITSTFEPGSIFKPLVVAAALEEGVITPETTFVCEGKKQVYDRQISCWYHAGHGVETVEDVLANSCNVGMMEIVEKLGATKFYEYQKDFGFGEKTGIDLPGEESAADLMYDLDQIGPVELATMSFGQSFNCTSIQILTAFASVINGGDLMRPYVVSQVMDMEGNIVKENKPEVVRKVVSQNTSDIIRTYLEATVDHGTGKNAKIEGYAIGGKTGTAEQGVRNKKDYTLSYISYFPVEDPQYICMVVIHLPKPYIDGVTTPSPMIKHLMEKIINYKSIESSYEIVNLSEEEAAKNTKVKADNYVGSSLSDALRSIGMSGLKYELGGQGNVVTGQVPEAGTEMTEGSTVLLYVERGENDTGDIQMPLVTGLTFDEAAKMLQEAGLSPPELEKTEGVVISQEPVAGTFVSGDDAVTLTMGEAPEEKKKEE